MYSAYFIEFIMPSLFGPIDTIFLQPILFIVPKLLYLE